MFILSSSILRTRIGEGELIDNITNWGEGDTAEKELSKIIPELHLGTTGKACITKGLVEPEKTWKQRWICLERELNVVGDDPFSLLAIGTVTCGGFRYSREWRYHMSLHVWLTRSQHGGLKEQTASYERGSYNVFDPTQWRKVMHKKFAKLFFISIFPLYTRPEIVL